MSKSTVLYIPASKRVQFIRHDGSIDYLRKPITLSSKLRLERASYRFFTRLVCDGVMVGTETVGAWGKNKP